MIPQVLFYNDATWKIQGLIGLMNEPPSHPTDDLVDNLEIVTS